MKERGGGQRDDTSDTGWILDATSAAARPRQRKGEFEEFPCVAMCAVHLPRGGGRACGDRRRVVAPGQ